MKRALASAATFLLAFIAASALSQTTPFITEPVGNGPEVDIADTVDGKVFVVNFSSNSVSVIDPVTWHTTTDIAVGSGPRRARLNNTTHKLYVLNGNGSSVSVINAATNAIVTTIALANLSNPWNLAIDETHNKVYVALRGAGQVAVIDGATDTLVTTVTTGNSPRSVCVNTVTNRVFIPAFERQRDYPQRRDQRAGGRVARDRRRRAHPVPARRRLESRLRVQRHRRHLHAHRRQ